MIEFDGIVMEKVTLFSDFEGFCSVVCFDQTLQTILDRGHRLPFPNGIVINGRGPNATTFTVEKGNLRFELELASLCISSCVVRDNLGSEIMGFFLLQVKLTGSEYRMWGWSIRSISGFKIMR